MTRVVRLEAKRTLLWYPLLGFIRLYSTLCDWLMEDFDTERAVHLLALYGMRVAVVDTRTNRVLARHRIYL